MPASAATHYRLLDAGDGERLEQWGLYRLRRPDPRAIGPRALPERDWRRVDASFSGEAGRGHWIRHSDVPERWTIEHGGLALVVKLAPFKHTGVFPEQAEHWRWMTRLAARITRAPAAADGERVDAMMSMAAPPADEDGVEARTRPTVQRRAKTAEAHAAESTGDTVDTPVPTTMFASGGDVASPTEAGEGNSAAEAALHLPRIAHPAEAHPRPFDERARQTTSKRGATGRRLDILNLFGYTGGATVALAKDGHKVTHVDASKPALAWARENAAANGLPADAIRWIQDDAATFVRRELRRGRRYDAALMDPPAFGHAPRGAGRGGAGAGASASAGGSGSGGRAGGRIWRIDDQLAPLVADTVALLVDPVFLLINHYARDADPRALASLVEEAAISTEKRRGAGTTRARTATAAESAPLAIADGRLEWARLRLRAETGAALDTGVYVRWARD